ncbi:MAG TPA: hypothetical protein DDZ51_10675 [Planctomycetaceae bacterium]|nr:hypothetical protein [Planctomycetaceae bacterium]
MGFLKRIFRNSITESNEAQRATGSFESLTDEELQTHMGISRYGVFELTDAVRPSYDLQIVPRQGFRHDEYNDEASGNSIPVLMASATRPILLDLFLDMLEPLGPVVDVVLESSHQGSHGQQDLYRDHIDMPVLKSILLEFEDLLLNDGCTGVAVVCPSRGQELQLDEHKVLVAYGKPLDEFEKILIAADVYPDSKIRFVTEAEHVHSSSRRYLKEFECLRMRLGMDTSHSGDATAW